MKSIRIAWKLPFGFILFSVLMSTALTIAGYSFSKSSVIDEEIAKFEAVLHGQGQSIQLVDSFFDKEFRMLANNQSLILAATNLGQAWAELPQGGTAEIVSAYVENSPYPVGERHLLDRADRDGPYHLWHGVVHPTLRDLMQSSGFYDLFIFNSAGDLVYSVFKEADFATNFLNGELSTTGLGTVFQAAVKAEPGQITHSDFAPYGPSNDLPASFAALPIFGETGTRLGVVAVQFPVDWVANQLSLVGFGETGDVVILGKDGTTRTPSRFAEKSETLRPWPVSETILSVASNHATAHSGFKGANSDSALILTLPLKVFDQDWILYAEKDMSELLVPVEALGQKLLGISAILAILFGVVGWIASRAVTSPLGQVLASIKSISDGDYQTDVKGLDRGDEIGAIAQALALFREKLVLAEIAGAEQDNMRAQQQKVVADLGIALKNLADGNLAFRLTEPQTEAYEELREDFNASIAVLERTISENATVSSSIMQGAEEILQASNELSRRTESQAAALTQSAASLNQMSRGLQSAAEGTRSAEASIAEARSEADRSGKVMQDAIEAMTHIRKASEQIEQFASVIEDIAFQTNLLALNAGVEAARAGESGRGFAVVASEVRSLAQRSSESAKEVRGLLEVSSKEVGRGVVLVEEAGGALVSIIDRFQNISSQISDIARAATEQSNGLDEISSAVSHLDQVTHQNATMVEECTAASQVLRGEALALTEILNQFKLTSATQLRYPGQSVPHGASFDTGYVESEGFRTAKPGRVTPPHTSMLRPRAVGGDAVWQDF